jgi:hypothetical protein
MATFIAAVDAAGVRQEALGQQPIPGAEDPDEPGLVGPLKRDEQLVQPAGPLRPLDQAERQAGPVRVPVGGREPPPPSSCIVTVAGRSSPVEEMSRAKAAYALETTGDLAGTFASACSVLRSMPPVAARS